MKEFFKIGLLFNGIAQFSTVIVQLILNMVLSRLLTPAEIGMVTLVQVIVFFFQIFANQGFVPALIQNKNLSEQSLGVIFNYTILLGFALVLIFGCLGGPLLSAIYHDSSYVPLCWSMSIMIFGSAVSAVPNAILSRNKQFKIIGIRTTLAAILGAAIGIISAFLHFGVYAMVIALTVPEITYLIYNLMTVRIKYSRSLRFTPVKQILYFSRHQITFYLINYFYRNLDNLLVGKFLGATKLGNYSKSYQLLSMPVTVLLSVIGPVLQPILSEHEHDIKLIRNVFLQVSEGLAVVSIPISVFFSLNAEPIIYFLFGNQWSQAIVPLSILSLSIWAQMLAQAMPPFWQSRNLPNLLSTNSIISLGIIGVSIIIGISTQSLNGVAAAVAISYIINFFVSATFLLHRGLDGQFRSLLSILIKPFIMGCALYLVLFVVQPYLVLPGYFLTLLLRGTVWLILTAIFLLITGESKKILVLFKHQ